MVPRRALPLLLSLALLAVPPAGATAGDCGSGADAGDSLAGATTLALPVGKCAGGLEAFAPGGENGVDAYRFAVAAGDLLHVELDHNPAAQLRLYDPGGALVAQTWDEAIEAQAGASGDWTLVLESHDVDPMPYVLSVARHRFDASGSFLAGHAATGVAPHGASALLGPGGSPAVDGAWVALPAPAQGGETARSTHDVWFYDAGATQALGGCRDTALLCAVPPGAAFALVTEDRTSLLPAYAFSYHW